MKKNFLIILVLIIAVGVVFWVYEKKDGGAKILVVGDMMFDRYIRQVSYNKGGDFIFSCQDSNGKTLGDFLKSFDLVVGNLEGSITENASKSMFTVPGGEGNYTFTFPTDTAKLLSENNIKLVSLGNNHIYNFGEVGVASTKRFLTEAGIDYFGLPANRESLVNQVESGGHKISFVNYNEFGAISVNDVIEKIKLEKEKEQIIIVYTHWGDEYVAPSEKIKKIAKSFVEAGSDFIIGSHPHVILENEIISGVPVYYSLGNFIFDQYFNKEVSTGLILELNIKNGKIDVTEHKVSLGRDGRTCLAD